MSTSMDRMIEIIVSPKGHTKITSRGYAGSTCKDATRVLEQALGTVESDRPTPEMYQPTQVGQHQGERQ